MIGYKFMGKAHANAYKKIPYMFWPPSIIPRLVAICGRTEERVAEAKRRYDFERYYTQWKKLIEDGDVQLLDNCAPNNIHAEPCRAAAKAGKHIICEKPLARNAAEAKKMLDAVNEANVKHMVAFNLRFIPAIKLTKRIVDERTLGQIYHFRAKYLLDALLDPDFPMAWRFDKNIAGSGVLGDIGSHIIDLARFLVGEPRYVSASLTTFVKERPHPSKASERGKVEVDDAFAVVVQFENGAIGTLEGSKFCPGRKNLLTFEINGSGGSIKFDLERLNELGVYLINEAKETRGFHQVIVTGLYHSFGERWWPPGNTTDLEDSYVDEIHYMLDAIVNDKKIFPHGATFEDGYRNVVICEAILESGKTGRKVEVRY